MPEAISQRGCAKLAIDCVSVGPWSLHPLRMYAQAMALSPRHEIPLVTTDVRFASPVKPHLPFDIFQTAPEGHYVAVCPAYPWLLPSSRVRGCRPMQSTSTSSCSYASGDPWENVLGRVSDTVFSLFPSPLEETSCMLSLIQLISWRASASHKH